MQRRRRRYRTAGRGRIVRLLMVGLAEVMLSVAPAVALLVRQSGRPNAATVPARHAQLAGRVVAVRRVAREVTIQTASGGVRRVLIARDATVRARGAAGLNAVRSGVRVELDTVTGLNGTPVARAVSVR